ncbi:MAG: serine/threonine protein kinase [Magnetococcales bacterium]|nr:serine/threonine protein kinase [Magnetococcales bacterium]
MSRFNIIEENIGEGGFGKISKAKDILLDRDVAIKTLDPLFKSAPSESDKARFIREAKALAKLSHPNVPAIYDILTEPSEFKIIFELINGLNLRKYLVERGPMSLDQAKSMLIDICSALRCAHSNNIIHRDVKPSNIIHSSVSESYYLVDFGISLSKTDLETYPTITTLGSPGYMSAEQEKGESAEPSDDIYALGVVLYECLSGSRPSIGEYAPLNDINDTIPTAIDELIKKCLQPRKNRINNIDDFIFALSKSLQPYTSMADIFSSGSLSDIKATLRDMDANRYQTLSSGKKRAILSRIKDLVNVDEDKRRNAVASLIASLIIISHKSNSNYQFIVSSALEYGFEKQYSEKWFGNPEIRDALILSSKEYDKESHACTTEELLKFFNNLKNFENKDKWYYHDLRSILNNLLVNDVCSDQHSDAIGDLLDKVNNFSHLKK